MKVCKFFFFYFFIEVFSTLIIPAVSIYFPSDLNVFLSFIFPQTDNLDNDNEKNIVTTNDVEKQGIVLLSNTKN